MDEYPYGVREALKELVDMESECRLQLDKLTQKEQQIYSVHSIPTVKYQFCKDLKSAKIRNQSIMSDIIDRKAEIRAKNAFSSADKVLRDAKVKYLKDEESLKPIR